MDPPGYGGQYSVGSEGQQRGRGDYRQDSSMRTYTLPSAYTSYMQGRNSQYTNFPTGQMQPPPSHGTAYNQTSYNWEHGVGGSYSQRPPLPPTPPVSSHGSKFTLSDDQNDQSSYYIPTYPQLPMSFKAESPRQLAPKCPKSTPQSFKYPTNMIDTAPASLSAPNSITNNNNDAKGNIDIDNDSSSPLSCLPSRSATPPSEASLFVPFSPSPSPAPRPKTRSSTTATLNTSLATTPADFPSSTSTPRHTRTRIRASRRKGAPLTPKPTRRNPATDPENIQIKDLHTVSRLAWSDIAVIMNEQRRAAGQPEPFTDAAVYGRFKRNAGKIAANAGEAFRMSDWIHMGVGRDGGLEVRAGRRGEVGAGSVAGEDGEMGGGERAGDLEGGDAMSGLADTPGLDVAMGTPDVDGFRAGGEGDTILSSAEDDEALLQCYDEVHSQPWLFVAEKLQQRTGKVVDAMTCMERVRVLQGGGS